ncbi:MAG: hypothetical protein QF415_00880 [Candidatus Undinarchaeales archaeon]|nr:hypothetical protein [Candidatus Undinarchaeales archaeon]MDP7491850.1 hypothetical protein [Candidatus Undinarchaeales archaeon]
MRAQTLLLILVVTFNAGLLWPVIGRGPPIGMDNSYHIGKLACLSDNTAEGGPVFGWCPEYSGGFPLFRYYQHVPYVVTLAMMRMLPLGVADVFNITLVLFFVAPALAIFLLARALGAPPGFAAALFLFYPTCWGHDHCAYFNLGVWTQPFGIFFAVLALWSLATRRQSLTALLLAITMASHLVLAYMLVPVIILFPLLLHTDRTLSRRLIQGMMVLVLAAALSAYWLVPTLATISYRGSNPWVQNTIQKRSLGLEAIDLLLDGRLLDGATNGSSEKYTVSKLGRPPVITALGMVGLALSLTRDRRCILLMLSFAYSMVLFIGSEVVTPLSYLPFEASLYYIRALALVEVFFAILAARGLGWLTGERAAGISLALVLLWPAVAQSDMWGQSGTSLSDSIARTVSVTVGGPARTVLLLMGAVVALASSRWPRGRRIAAVALVAVLLLPLGLERAGSANGHARSIRDYSHIARRVYGAADILAGLPGPGRVHTGGGLGLGSHWEIGILALRGGKDATSVYGAGLDHTALNHHIIGPRLQVTPGDLAMAGVRYVVSTKPLSQGWLVERPHDYDGFHLYEVPSASYAATVDRAPLFQGTWNEWKEFADKWDRRTIALFYMDGPISDVGPTFGPGEPVPDVDQRTTPVFECQSARTSHTCTVRSDNHGFLVLRVAFFPDWHATYDGEEIPMFVAAPFFMAVGFAPGIHEITFTWRQSYLVTLSVLVSLAVSLALVYGAARRL